MLRDRFVWFSASFRILPSASVFLCWSAGYLILHSLTPPCDLIETAADLAMVSITQYLTRGDDYQRFEVSSALWSMMSFIKLRPTEPALLITSISCHQLNTGGPGSVWQRYLAIFIDLRDFLLAFMAAGFFGFSLPVTTVRCGSAMRSDR